MCERTFAMNSKRKISRRALSAKRTAGSLHRDCCAALAVYFERKKREARRKWSSRTGGSPTKLQLASYWEGQYVALVKLQRRLERMMKAQHNGEVSHRSGPVAT